MRRAIDQALRSWKDSPRRKPLIVQGARQVGKTYSIKAFGQSAFASTVTIDFSANAPACRIFDGSIAPADLIPQLEALTGQPILPSDTLLFFDEVQACPRALTSLKYFYEETPTYHVIAAGSLLGISLGREDYSFPVGKVDRLVLYPLSFEEYLWALGKEQLAELIQDDFAARQPCNLHELALELYRSYLLVGGMPEAVALHAEGASHHEVAAVQRAIVDAYVADMTKYASPLSSARILNVWRSVPQQLAKENHKFQYATIASSARAHQYEAPIQWLSAAGIVTRCYRVSEGLRPLNVFVEQDFFKLYLVDVGLLASSYGLEERDLLPAQNKVSRARGALAENYVIEQLLARGMEPFYWGASGRAEVDFVIETREAGVVPIEVKSGTNVTARSMEAFRKRYDPDLAIRISARQLGYEKGILSVPLYAAFCIGAEGM